MNIEILSVGTELLLGNTANTNARDLSQYLAELGLNVFWHTVVGDNPARLTECVFRARNRADIIITTGGLGPTCDDLTKQVLAKAFGRELYYDETIAEGIRSFFTSRKRPYTENNLRQAWLPKGCKILPNDCGTAPGCIFKSDGILVIMLPGPPSECRMMFRRYVAPYLRTISGETILSHQLRMVGIGESTMEAKLRDMMDAANPTVAPYAKEGECLVRVTAKGASEEACEEAMKPVIEEIRRRIGDFIYDMDSESLEETVSRLLDERGLTLAAAESCTGGLLAQRITALPGASNRFRGGAVVYTVDAKNRLLGLQPEFIEEHGVVSLEVAGRMAKRVRVALGSDYGIGITGWAGPDGDEVGLVYVGLACKGECFVRRLNLGKTTTREKIRIMAVNNAFDMLRRHMTGLEV